MKIVLPLTTVLALSACGGATTSGVTASEVAAYQRAALSASTAVTNYQTATSAMTTPAECQAAVQQYSSQMSAAIQSMQQTAGAMDDHMRSMGQPGAADMSCGAAVMAQQLQQHLAVACSSPDMTQNQQTAAAHCQVMSADSDHLQMRAAGMGAMTAGGNTMMGDGGMTGTGGMMGDAGMAAAMSGMMDGGYTAPDGHHMSWGEPMNGCTMSGGMYQPSTTSPATGG